ncbi:hypothetical protein GALMADRAFT_256381 [Galerina marginata CBS 339.88]|uniref:Uncharacterized protein n=1 Tax=Galerina marginata (strain CBS 339.88) TaxID=685588 RepID=A0A067SME5_GALM3|nr:hypothetical protein GALMADRAFT_256381 [Galerina marginata CBS 339.88]
MRPDSSCPEPHPRRFKSSDLSTSFANLSMPSYPLPPQQQQQLSPQPSPPEEQPPYFPISLLLFSPHLQRLGMVDALGSPLCPPLALQQIELD